MKILHYLSILAITAIIVSCSKGDTGPAGPVGATGATGLNGVANIVTSTYTVITIHTPSDTSSSWVSTGSPTYHWIAGFIDTNITSNNLDAVYAYWCTNLGTGWVALPNPSLINQGDNLSFRYNDDSVSFTYYTGGAPYTKYPGYPATSPAYGTLIFKVVIIPPALALSHPETNWKNAAEVALLPEVQAALTGK